jgi:prepilin-type N-terminal cleavage/methylation domain-containing protein
MTSARHKCGRGFTLIELLVTLGVIALLVGIAVPAFSGALAQSRRTECLSNLRSLMQGLQIYMGQESQGVLPACPSFSLYHENPSYTRIYEDVLNSYLSATPPARTDGVFRSVQPFACPLDDDIAPQFGYSYRYKPGNFMAPPWDNEAVDPKVAPLVTQYFYESGRVRIVLSEIHPWHQGDAKEPWGSASYWGRLAAFFDGSVGWADEPDW